MKTDNHLSDSCFARHLRHAVDKKIAFGRILLYILLALTGVLMSALTNASGVRYDGDGGEVFRQPYRLESATLELFDHSHGRIFDFTKPLATAAPLTDFDYDAAEILGAKPDADEVILGLPAADSTAVSVNSLYFPSVGLMTVTVVKEFQASNIVRPTLFLNRTLYNEYNRAYEALRQFYLVSADPRIKDRPCLDLEGGVLSTDKLDADIYLSAADQSLAAYGIPAASEPGTRLTVNGLLNGRKRRLSVKIVDGPTQFDFAAFSELGKDVVIGSTVLYTSLKDAYKARLALSDLEDSYAAFNSAVAFSGTYDALYAEAAVGLVAVYAVLIAAVFLTAVKSRQGLMQLNRLGFDHRISVREYGFSTAILSLIAVLGAFGVLIGLTNFFEKLGAIVWFNAFDYILILLIEALIAGLDIFVATRRR